MAASPIINDKNDSLGIWNHHCKVELAFKTALLTTVSIATFLALSYAFFRIHNYIDSKKWTKIPSYVHYIVAVAFVILLRVKKSAEESAASLDLAENYFKPATAAITFLSWLFAFPVIALNSFFDKRAYYLGTVRTETADNLHNRNFEDIAKAYGHRSWGLFHTNDWENLIHYGFIKGNATVDVQGTEVPIQEWLKSQTAEVIQARKVLTDLEKDIPGIAEQAKAAPEYDPHNADGLAASVAQLYKLNDAKIKKINEKWNEIKGSVCHQFSISRENGRNLLEKYLFETGPRIHSQANAEEEEA